MILMMPIAREFFKELRNLGKEQPSNFAAECNNYCK
jgi:hypothetical protein